MCLPLRKLLYNNKNKKSIENIKKNIKVKIVYKTF